MEREFHSRTVVLIMCFMYTLKVFHSLYSFFFPKSVSTNEFEIESWKFLDCNFFSPVDHKIAMELQEQDAEVVRHHERV